MTGYTPPRVTILYAADSDRREIDVAVETSPDEYEDVGRFSSYAEALDAANETARDHCATIYDEVEEQERRAGSARNLRAHGERRKAHNQRLHDGGF